MIRPDAPRAGLPVYGGLFFTTLSTLAYEILLTRIFSVTMWYHFAFVAVSVALFGMTVGALIVYLSPTRFPQDRTQERLFQAGLLFSITTVLSFMTQLAIPFDPKWSLISVYSIAFTYLIISAPFLFSGIAVCLALTRFPGQVSRLYAVDLFGAAVGTVTFIWLINLLQDGPSAVLAVAALAAVGAVSFGYMPHRLQRPALAGLVVVLLLGLAVGNAASARKHHAVLRIPWAKGQSEQVATFEKWNAYSRIRVIGNPDGGAGRPWGWGLSRTMPKDLREKYIFLGIDATALTPIVHYDGTSNGVEHLRYDVVNMVHYIRPQSNVFVVGAGGGRDVLSAIVFDQPSVTAVELNADIVKLVNGRFGDYSGHLDKQPGVKFVADEARSYLARSDERFDVVQLSLIDTWAATAAGAFSLSENSLYTVEAWDTFLDHLTNRGVLSVTRWYQQNHPLQAYRLTALATAALRRQGAANPRDHVVLVKSEPVFFDLAAGVILVSREPFTPADIARIEEVARQMHFEVVLAPPPAKSKPVFAAIADAKNANDVPLELPVDISPPTDDRPFFFQMIGFRDLFEPSLYGFGIDELTQPVLVLFSLSLAVIGLTLLCILLPLLITTSRRSLHGHWPMVAFFCGIGLAFLLLEISQLQRLIIFLGHPTYALSVVLFSLLIFSGLGSLASEQLVVVHANPKLDLRVLRPFAALLAVLVVFGFMTPTVIHHFDGATTPGRIAVAVAILAPMGLLMGVPFPLGMRVASLRPDAPTTFFWGINGATSVCASVLAVAISLGWGISMAFWAGCLAYAIAALALGYTVLRPGGSSPGV